MKTLGFVVPFKSKLKAKNWPKESALLHRTLHSLLNQEDQSFEIYVVYTDLPENPVKHDKVKWVLFPFDFAPLANITDLESFVRMHRLENLAEGYLDQGKRVLYGATHAKKDGCQYIMSVDADDLISCMLVSFIASQGKGSEPGWFVNKGYVFDEGSRFLQKVPKNMHHLNGSVNIVRADLVPEPDFSLNRLENFAFFPAHGYLTERIRIEYGRPLKEIPFYATIYVRHRYNWSLDNNDVKISVAREYIKRIVRFQYLTYTIRIQFGLQQLYV